MNSKLPKGLFYAAQGGTTFVMVTTIDRGIFSDTMTMPFVNKTTPMDECTGQHNLFYPNPANGVLKNKEQFHAISCSVLDMSGKLIMP
jgi:hypothetical protein